MQSTSVSLGYCTDNIHAMIDGQSNYVMDFEYVQIKYKAFFYNTNLTCIGLYRFKMIAET